MSHATLWHHESGVISYTPDSVSSVMVPEFAAIFSVLQCTASNALHADDSESRTAVVGKTLTVGWRGLQVVRIPLLQCDRCRIDEL